MAKVIGIDLGTTNCALAWTGEAGTAARLLPIPQVISPSEVREESLLPSSLYLSAPEEFPPGSLDLPWDTEPQYIVGRFAQKRGAENAGRLVTSAKSWLSHAGIDRTSAILPWEAPFGVPKISAIEASAAYLRHLRAAWDAAHPEDDFSLQQKLVTVPASFDEVARELTVRAAAEAGFGDTVLLEEPQAAFYAWIDAHPNWREIVHAGNLILVVDIGGGTTDFSLIAVQDRAGDLALERVAVGEHILLGGDNIDLALAHTVASRLTTKLDRFQMQTLWNHCRAGKEKLLEAGATADSYPVTILGQGSGMVGNAIRADLRREDIARVLEGFFPLVARTDLPEKRKGAVQELGLPYAADAAVTRYLARFLATAEPGRFAQPTHVLFNGGVLHAPFVRERILYALESWLGSPIQMLTGEDLMHAVARGAAYYGAARNGAGVRIRSGISRSYYVGVESSSPAVPGWPAPVKALAVAQFGMEEGTSTAVPGREFGLLIGEPAEFRFFSSAERKGDAPGEIIDDAADVLEEMPSMSVNLSGEAARLVPVTFETVIAEVGLLQLWCVAADGHRWKLEFNVRERIN